MLRAVGITLVTRRVDEKTRTQLLREGNFQLALLQHVGISGDPDYLRRWSAGQETNDAAQGFVWRDAAYSQLANAQAETLDPAQRRALVAQLQVRLADELPTIPLYMRRFHWLYNSSAYTPMNTFGGPARSRNTRATFETSPNPSITKRNARGRSSPSRRSWRTTARCRGRTCAFSHCVTRRSSTG